MLKYLIAYAATAVIFLGLDVLWLSSVSTSFYRKHLGGLLLETPNLAIGGAFYLVYVVGLVFFAVVPALSGGTWINAALSAALLGIVAYGTYDITNLSTLKGWSLSVSLVDMGWGAVLSAIAATGGYLVTRWLAP